jgi:hypothetical protein
MTSYSKGAQPNRGAADRIGADAGAPLVNRAVGSGEVVLQVKRNVKL